MLYIPILKRSQNYYLKKKKREKREKFPFIIPIQQNNK